MAVTELKQRRKQLRTDVVEALAARRWAEARRILEAAYDVGLADWSDLHWLIGICAVGPLVF